MSLEILVSTLAFIVGACIGNIVTHYVNLKRRRELDADYRQRIAWALDQLAIERDRADRAVDLLAKISSGSPISQIGVAERSERERKAEAERRQLDELFATEVGEAPAEVGP